MKIATARRQDFDEIVALVNRAYRSGEGWTHEAGLVDGPRTSREDLEREVSGSEPATILCLRDAEDTPILACVLLRKKQSCLYLGMLSVLPSAMDRGLGRTLLEASEDYARARDIDRIEMSVIDSRDTLIAWYERRGYQRTGESVPFPLAIDIRFAVLAKQL